MSLAVLYSRALEGMEADLVTVEVHLANGLPGFTIVGLPETEVKESRERVRAALQNCQFDFPARRITVNLAPADLPKESGRYDLPIALGILAASGQIPTDKLGLYEYAGELALTGEVRPVRGTLAMTCRAVTSGRAFILPEVNAAEAALVEHAVIYPAKTLLQVAAHLSGRELIEPYLNRPQTVTPHYPDFSEVKGQEQVKRALEIAAAGGHSVLMIGPPGSGKTLLARSLPELLPPLTLAESLEVTKIYSVAGLLPTDQPLISERPFRNPHHTASGTALVGGGSFPKPGEITLAHRGVLFLDELPEFPRSVLENLRQPLEDGLVTVARASQTLQFPASFTLVAAANPCPCGFLTDTEKECQCLPTQILKYQKRVSGPLLDRFDLQIEVPRIKFIDLQAEAAPDKIQALTKNIAEARKIQLERFKNIPEILTNSEIPGQNIEQYCPIDETGKKLLKEAMHRLHLSARGYHRVIKVARTIADLAHSPTIKTEHLAEALQFRINQEN